MEHGLSICKELKLKFLENFQLQLPDKKAIRVLAKLCEEEKGMRTREILDFLREKAVEGFEKEYKKLDRGGKINYLMKLNKGILEKLENSGYIIREKTGRFSLIRITESGKYVAHISGLLPPFVNVS
jgi:predicted transcriptional regulator